MEAANLNNIIDQAFAKPEIISSQSAAVPTPAEDYITFLDITGPTLKKCLINQLPSGASSVGLSMPVSQFDVANSPVTTTGTLTVTWKNQDGNKFFAGNASGPPTFRLLGSADLALASVPITDITINWQLGNVFYKVLTGNTTFYFSNITDGQVIKVLIAQAANGGGPFAAGWQSGIWWPGGVVPVNSATPNAVDIYTFVGYGTSAFGKVDLGYLPV